MDWTLLQTFLNVAASGSFSTAAKQLDLSQPTVSRHVQALERQLRYKVFLRHSRGVMLTERGIALFEQARGLDVQIGALLRRQPISLPEALGSVRLSVNEPIGLYVLPDWLKAMRVKHPQLQLEISIDNELSDLSRREADVAVRMLRPEAAHLVGKRIGAVPLGLFAHESYIARHGEPEGIEQIGAHTVLGMDAHRLWPAQVAALGLRREDFSLRTDSLALQFEALLRGVGIAGTHLALARRHPELRQVLRGVRLPPLEMWVVVHEELRRERAVALVFDALCGFLSTYVAPAT
jgi:DNA-binding transcriptional LysR family regulator